MTENKQKENYGKCYLKGLCLAFSLFVIVVIVLVIFSHLYYESYSKRLSYLHQDLQCMECCISENSEKYCVEECKDRVHCDWHNDPNYSKAKITQAVEDILKQGDHISLDMNDEKQMKRIKEQLKEEILKQDTPSAHLVVANTGRTSREKRKTQSNHVAWQWTDGAGEAFNTKLSNKHAFHFNQTNGKLTINVLQSGQYNLQMHTTFIAGNRLRSHKVKQKLYKKENLENPILKECRKFSTKYCTLESSAVIKLTENDQLNFVYHWPSDVEISSKESDTFISLYMIASK